MILEKVEHIGIAVRDLNAANTLYTQLLGVPPYKIEIVESEWVRTSFFAVGNTKIELLEPIAQRGAIAQYLEKRGEGIHHIAYEVSDIRAAMEHLAGEGFQLLNDSPKRGADNKWVCFIHPKTAGGVLVELCQSIADVDLVEM